MPEKLKRIFTQSLDSKPVQLAAWGLTVIGTKLSLISSTPARQTLPLPIQETIGSVAIPAVGVLAAGLVSKHIEATGQYYENKKLEQFGRRVYKAMLGIIIILNVGIETQFIQRPELKTENARDMVMGFLAISCAGVAARSLRRVVENISLEIRERLVESNPRAIIG